MQLLYPDDMPFIPNLTFKEEMLKELGIKDIDELFSDVPNEIKISGLNLPQGLSQMEVENRLRKIAKKNLPFPEFLSFLGGGIKPHYIPATVRALLARSEFYTAYTPYQPEVSQGFLQAMFEYQSMIAELTGMDVANSSLYDGATALGEAMRMAYRITRKNTILIPNNISWEKKEILKNYIKGAGLKIINVPYNDETGTIDTDYLTKNVSSDTAVIYVENPNYFGIFEENVLEIAEIAHRVGALFVVGIDPLTLGIVKGPGDYEADVVIGEGRALGISMNFGGSSLGIFACKKEHLRQMPGRIIGLTHDSDGNRAFCMTLQTREQHIRRGKATSNICTNEGLCALAAVIYLSTLGSRGLVELGKRNLEMGKLFARKICSLPWFKMKFKGSHFNEFVVKSSQNVEYLNKELLKKDIQIGINLEKHYPELENSILFGITELYKEEDIDRLLTAIKEVYYV